MEQNRTYPPFFQVPCLAEKQLQSKYLHVSVPGSKSITNRALLIAALAEGTSVLEGALFCEDSRSFLKCIQDLGIETNVRESDCRIAVKGLGGSLPVSAASLNVGSAGTAARFLTAYLGITPGVWHLDSSEQMRRRPMAPLLEALSSLGCETVYGGQPGFFPFTLTGRGLDTSKVRVNIDHSSQFLSALLISSCLCRKPLDIEVEGSHGMSYIHMTLRMMEQFGVHTLTGRGKNAVLPERQNGSPGGKLSPAVFSMQPGQRYKAMDYRIEPDVSAACYFYAFAALTGCSVTVSHVTADSMQGDIRFLELLTQMGCIRQDTPEGICITGPAGKHLKGIDADMSACSDQAITLAAIAPFAGSPTTISGIGHIRFQESDRIHAIATELSRLGIRCEEKPDSITIYPGIPQSGMVNTYDDHRMAMGFSLTGLRAPGITIDNPGCCRKTFENYFDVLGACVAECL